MILNLAIYFAIHHTYKLGTDHVFPIYAVLNKGNRDTERAVAAYRRKRNL